jgi:hypothetical protein
MSTKYVIHEWRPQKIHAYECDKETAAFVWLKGLHCADGATKKAKCGTVFDTWEEAHAELTRRADAHLNGARRQLDQAQGFAGNVRGMKPPQGEGVEV